MSVWLLPPSLPVLAAAPGPATPPAEEAGQALSYLFASDIDGDGDIYAVTVAGEVTNLTYNREPDWDPALSPAGTGYAFVSRRDGNSEIYVAPLGRGEAINVSRNSAFDYEPAWSPAGTHLVFVSERDGGRDLYTLDLVHDITRRLTQAGAGEVYRSPAWSPDGGAIAYSCVRQGVEQVYVLEFGGQEWQITHWPLKGRYPAWSPDGKWLAFAGWHEDNRPGVYIASSDGSEVRWLWEGRAPISNLAWVGQHILFTMADSDGHDIYSLDGQSGHVTRLVSGPGWEDCFAAGSDAFLVPVQIGTMLPDDYGKKLPVVLGVNIADLSDTYLIKELGFGWIKNYLSWAGVEPKPGEFDWEDADNVVKAGRRAGVSVLLRIHDTPSWARPDGTSLTYPPSDLGAYYRFLSAVAWRYRGRVAAYEIGNEPNLAFEWGGQTPDPVRYTLLLRLAYHAIKAVDPNALVVSGGLATTGDGGEGAMGDLVFLRGMYEVGAKGCFDALGSHPYGFGNPPFVVHPYGLAVTRLVQQRAIMVEYGDIQTPIWATEVGWPIASPWSMGEHDKYAVSEQVQAFFLQQLHLQAAQSWPWLQGLFLFNLDFATVPWYDARQPMRWYSILEADGSPRLAFTWLRGIGD